MKQQPFNAQPAAFLESIKMNIPHAEEARRAAMKFEYDKAARQAAEVEAMIIKAIASGARSVGGDGSLEPNVKAKLEEFGYKCSDGSQYNEIFWSVSW